MLHVTDLNKNVEPLNSIQGFEMEEEVNGTNTVQFTSFFVDNNPGHELLGEEALVTVHDRKFIVKQYGETLHRKNIMALSSFYELSGHRQELIHGGTRLLNDFAEFAFSGTGWTFENIDVTHYALIPNFGEDNVIKLIQAMCSAFDCEYQIMANNHVVFKKEIGPDNGAQYRYGHNVKVLSKTVDTNNLRTQITGHGANGLEVTYTSPNAEIYGIKKADPITNEDMKTADQLLELLKQELTDYPEITIELDSLELIERELGERVWLIYEPMNMEFQTRILSKKSVIQGDKLVTSSVVIGNSVPRDPSDNLIKQKVEIDENKKWSRTKFHQTNERITTEAERFDGEILEAYAYVNHTADGIKTDVGNLGTYVDAELGEVKQEATSNFNILAGQITASASTSKQYTDDLFGEVEEELSANFNILSGQINAKADSVTVTDLGNRVNGVEWNLDAVNGEISQKVSYTDYNGETMISRINQTAGAVTIDAGKIQLNGITNVNERLMIGTGFGSDASIGFNGTNIWLDAYGDTLNINGSFLQMNTRVDFNRSVDFSGATVTGLTVPYATNAGNASYASNAGAVGGIAGSSLLRAALSHQGGSTFEFTGSQMIVRTPSGSTLRFNAA